MKTIHIGHKWQHAGHAGHTGHAGHKWQRAGHAGHTAHAGHKWQHAGHTARAGHAEQADSSPHANAYANASSTPDNPTAAKKMTGD